MQHPFFPQNPYTTADLPEYNPDLNLRKQAEWQKGVNAGIDELQGMGGGIVGLAGQYAASGLKELGAPKVLTGAAEGVRDWGLDVAERNFAEAQAGPQAPKIARVENIENFGDAMSWASYQLPKGLINVGTAIGGGGVGGLIGRGLIKKGVTGTINRQIGEQVGRGVVDQAAKDLAKAEARKFMARGAATGATATAFGMEGGAAFSEQSKLVDDPSEAMFSATAVGGINAALEFLPLYGIAKKIGMDNLAKKELAQVFFKDKKLGATAVELARRIGGAGAVGAAMEGTTEALQELVNVAGKRWAEESELFAELSLKEKSQILNAGAAGGLTGAAIGGGRGVFVGPKDKKADTKGPGTVETDVPPADVPPALGGPQGTLQLEGPQGTLRLEGPQDGPQSGPQGTDPLGVDNGPVPRLGGPTPDAVNLNEMPINRIQEAEGVPVDRVRVAEEQAAQRMDALRQQLEDIDTAIDDEVDPTVAGELQQQRDLLANDLVQEEEFQLTPPPAPQPREQRPPQAPEVTGRERELPGMERQLELELEPRAEQLEMDLEFGRVETNTRKQPYKSYRNAEIAAERYKKAGKLEQYDIVEEQGNEDTQFVIRDLGPKPQPVETDFTTPFDDLMEQEENKNRKAVFFYQDKDGNLVDEERDLSDEEAARVEAEQNGQGSFFEPRLKVKDGELNVMPYGKARRLAREGGLRNAQIVPQGNGYVLRGWKDEYTSPQKKPQVQEKGIKKFDTVGQAMRRIIREDGFKGIHPDLYSEIGLSGKDPGFKSVRKDENGLTHENLAMRLHEAGYDIADPYEDGVQSHNDVVERIREEIKGENARLYSSALSSDELANVLGLNRPPPLPDFADTNPDFVNDFEHQTKVTNDGTKAWQEYENIFGEQAAQKKAAELTQKYNVDPDLPLPFDALLDVKEELAQKREPEDIFFSKPDAEETRSISRDEAIKELESVFGRHFVKRLLDSELVTIHDGEHASSASGFWHNGKIQLNTRYLSTKGTAASLLLHEGSHAGLNVLLGGKLYAYMADIKKLVESGNEIARQAAGLAQEQAEANAAAQGREVSANEVMEETVAYYIELTQEANIANGVTRRLSADLAAGFSQTTFGRVLRGLGLGVEMNGDVLSALARRALNETVSTAEFLEWANKQTPETVRKARVYLGVPPKGVVDEAEKFEDPKSKYEATRLVDSAGTQKVVFRDSDFFLKQGIDKGKARTLEDVLEAPLFFKAVPDALKIQVEFTPHVRELIKNVDGKLYINSRFDNSNINKLREALLDELHFIYDTQWGGVERQTLPNAPLLLELRDELKEQEAAGPATANPILYSKIRRALLDPAEAQRWEQGLELREKAKRFGVFGTGWAREHFGLDTLERESKIDPKDDGIMYSMPNRIWRYGLENVIATNPQKVGTAQQWKAVLTKQAKKEELEDSGVKEFIDQAEAEGRKVTRDELLDFVAQGGVKLEEVLHGGSPEVVREYEAHQAENREKVEVLRQKYAALHDEFTELSRQAGQTSVEESAAIAEKLMEIHEEQKATRAAIDEARRVEYSSPVLPVKFRQYMQVGGENMRELLLRVPSIGESYDNPHWSQNDVVAHLIFDERDVNGKALFVQEIQSDLHQEGRERSYSGKSAIAGVKEIQLDGGTYWAAVNKDGEQLYRSRFQNETIENPLESPHVQFAYEDDTPEQVLAEMRRDLEYELVTDKFEGGVPDAPFKNNWALLAAKRAIKWAAAYGQEKIAFSTGWDRIEDYGSNLAYWERDGKNWKLHYNEHVEADQLYDYTDAELGESNLAVVTSLKDVRDYLAENDTQLTPAKREKLANRLWEAMNEKDFGEIQPRREGMEFFYDQKLPNELNKYLKRFGLKVQKEQYVNPEFNASKEYDEDETRPVWTFEINDALRAEAKKGMPMYSFAGRKALPSLTGKERVEVSKALATVKATQEFANALPTGVPRDVINTLQERRLTQPDAVFTPEEQQILEQYDNYKSYAKAVVALGSKISERLNAPDFNFNPLQYRKPTEVNELISIAEEFVNGGKELGDPALAQRMLHKEGRTIEEVLENTGWWYAPDKTWKYEISDAEAFVIQPPQAKKVHPLNEILVHDKLFAVYPELKFLKVYGDPDMSPGSGEYNFSTGRIKISPDDDDVAVTLMHEVQHAIQEIEDFGRGTSTSYVAGQRKEITKFERQEYKKIVDLQKAVLDGKTFGTLMREFRGIAATEGKLSDQYLEKEIEIEEAKEKLNAEIAKNPQVGLSAKIAKAVLTEKYDDIKLSNFQLYEGHWGEQEARLTTERLGYTDKQRQQTKPWEDYDYNGPRFIITHGLPDGSAVIRGYNFNQRATPVKEGEQTAQAELADSLYSFASRARDLKQWAWTDRSDPDQLFEMGATQRWYANYVDMFATMEAQDLGVKDAYDLAESKKGAKLDEINRLFTKPLLGLVNKTGLKMEELNDWLAARHIVEDNVNHTMALRASYQFAKDLRAKLEKPDKKALNKEMKRIRKEMTGTAKKAPTLTEEQGRQEMHNLVEYYITKEKLTRDPNAGGVRRQVIRWKWQHFKEHASGMFMPTLDANGYPDPNGPLKNTNNLPNAWEIYQKHKGNAEVQAVATKLDELSRHQLKLLQEGRLITLSEMQAMLADKKAYVPLRREAFDYENNLDFFTQGRGPGKGVSTRIGTEAANMKPVHVIQNMLANAHGAASAAQRNLANNYLYDQIIANPDAWINWFQVGKDNTRTRMDKFGFAQHGKSDEVNPTDIMLLRGGERLIIKPIEANQRAMHFAAAANKLSADKQTAVTKAFKFVNSFVRFTAVSASVPFLLTNIVRDPLTAAYNMQATEAGDYTKEIINNYGKSFKALYQVFFKEQRVPGDPLTQMVEDWEKVGGRISFIESLREMDSSWKSFETQSKLHGNNLTKPLMKLFDKIESANIAVENVMRLATFDVLKNKPGMTQEKAARIAKDLTTNFNRKGFQSSSLGTLYLFFNATMQGNAQVIRNVMGSKKLQAATGGTIFAAYLLDTMGRALADTDDEGENEWDKIPEYEKRRNIILPFKVGDSYIKIPAPWVYNVIWRMGGMIGELQAGKIGAGDATVDLAAMVATSMNPVGGGTLAQAVTPTALDPFMQSIENKDFAGNPLRPFNFPGAGSKPNAELYWDKAPEWAKDLARALNEGTGGNAAESGWLDISPEDIDNFVNFLGAGLLSFGKDFAKMPELIDKGSLTEKDIPVLKQYLARPSDGVTTGLYYDNVAKVYGADKALKAYSEGKTRDLEKAREIRTTRADHLSMVTHTKDVERQIRSLRTRLRAAQGRGDDERAEALRGKISQIQARYNQRYAQRINR